MDYATLLGQILMIVGVLTAFVNITTEVAKNTFDFMQGSKTINLFVLLLSLITSVGSLFAYWQMNSWEITWYIVAAFAVVGVLVAYAAMFGYDRLLKYFEKETEEKS